MAQIVYARRALKDLDRFFEFFGDDVGRAAEALSVIEEAVSILERHPMIGRPIETGLGELVISHEATGYVALCRYLPKDDTVLVLTLRHQREAGYKD